MSNLKTPIMELALADYFDTRRNIIVPNVAWGFFVHECDLLIVTQSWRAWEVEIKVSKSDLLADKKKSHGHSNRKISRLYFAIPEDLTPYIYSIPERAGIIVVDESTNVKKIREASTSQNSYKLSDKEILKVARLGAMRVWNLKRKIISKGD